MCKGEDNGGYTLHPTVLPEEYHGLTNKNRKDAKDLRILSLNQESEMIINGTVYDVSAFIKRHPGGSIIKLRSAVNRVMAHSASDPLLRGTDWSSLATMSEGSAYSASVASGVFASRKVP